MELSGAEGDFYRGLGQLHFGFLHCPFRPGHLWQNGRKEDWWTVGLQGDMEKLEVQGFLPGTEGGSVDPKRKKGHWSARIKTTKEGSEELKGAERETGK